MRLAWFSPLPPTRSGVAAYSAELLPVLARAHAIDAFPEAVAHDFVWKQRRDPYDLVVYQLGNAPCHDYMWAYLAGYPGLVVLHDARLHHARARSLLKDRRFDDYRSEFAYDHPDARADVAEYAVEGLAGPIYYFWSMLRVVMRTARVVTVHNGRVADDLRAEYPDVAVESIRMGVPRCSAAIDRDEQAAVSRRALGLPDDAMVFAAFGKLTAEKRIDPILRALAALIREGQNAWLLVIGDADAYHSLGSDLARLGLTGRVRVTGHVSDAAIDAHLAAADACLCLRWPTAEESSGSWLQCLAAAKATVLTDLAHLVDIPDAVALRVDLVDEDASLGAAMRTLSLNRARRDQIAQAGYEHWAANHTIDAMASDYAPLLERAAARPIPVPPDLPAHFTNDHSAHARRLAAMFGLDLDRVLSSKF